MTIDFADAQVLTKTGQNDFFLGGSSTSDLRILGSANNAAETHNIWISDGNRGHFQWVNFDSFQSRTASGYTNSAPIFSVNGSKGNRNYWSAHAVKETNRPGPVSNDGMLWVLFNMRHWADDYCSAVRLGGPGCAFKDSCYQTSSRYIDVSTDSGNFSFAFMGQSGSGNNELCYSKVKGPFWFNLQAGPDIGKMVEYRNTIRATDTNQQQAVRSWKGSRWVGPYVSKNSVLMSNGPDIVNSAVTVTGAECHATNSGGDQSIDTATMTLQNKTGGTQYRDLYLYIRGHEIG